MNSVMYSVDRAMQAQQLSLLGAQHGDKKWPVGSTGQRNRSDLMAFFWEM
jgi:hypothetical protein